ncbi:MAG TPA: hypothetical protein VMV41_05525 [Cellulomonadaceae bacterium]|nr:hypothetical protein [Cellulomonadaceae bacterium]
MTTIGAVPVSRVVASGVMLRTCSGTAVDEGDADVTVDPDAVPEPDGAEDVGSAAALLVAATPMAFADPGEGRFVTIIVPTAMAATVTAARVPTASRTPDDRLGLFIAAACPFRVCP